MAICEPDCGGVATGATEHPSSMRVLDPSGVDAGSRCGGQVAGGDAADSNLPPAFDAADSKDTGSGDRYVVAGVASSGGERGAARVVVLTLTHAASGATREVQLKGAWADTQVAAGDHVVVMGTGDFSGHASQLVVHPDRFLSASRISESFRCVRSTVLGEMVKDNTCNL